MKNNRHKEWLIQAEYDLESAEILFKSGKYLHALFLCHLALEKSLKAAYELKEKVVAPKTHNLSFLFVKSGLVAGEEVRIFIKAMSDLSVVTRYPDDLKNLLYLYNREKTAKIVKETKGTIIWIKEELEKSTGS